MAKRKYALGIDFGTLSARALLVDVANGKEVATDVWEYTHGVIDDVLPAGRVKLPHDWALQDPDDYITALKKVVPAVLRKAKVKPADILGVGTDFTGCTLIPVDKQNRPLCTLPQFRKNPNAWVKLWKHHGAQAMADRVNALARQRGETWLARYGGKISSEWFFPKALQILEEAPQVYAAADRLIEGADWIVLRLTGNERRSTCPAGYKAIWSQEDGYPSRDFLAALNPKLADIVETKMKTDVYPVGRKAGGITREMAKLTGLLEGTPVATGTFDAHAGVPGSSVVTPGRMCIIMGTSSCHMVLGREMKIAEGMCGVVRDGIIPGYYGFEAGQCAVGDIFAWFVENCVPASYAAEARKKKVSVHQVLEEKARKLRPGQSGLLCIDWHNGNRSVLVDAHLSGLHVGMTLATSPEETYRALIEATAFGTRTIIEAFTGAGVEVNEIVACGGLPRNKMLMQIYADVTGRPIQVAASEQTCALGSAIFGAVAAGSSGGGYDTVEDAVARMARVQKKAYEPNEEYHRIYSELFREYGILHDYFGRGVNDAMKRLKKIKAQQTVLATRKRK